MLNLVGPVSEALRSTCFLLPLNSEQFSEEIKQKTVESCGILKSNIFYLAFTENSSLCQNKLVHATEFFVAFAATDIWGYISGK